MIDSSDGLCSVRTMLDNSITGSKYGEDVENAADCCIDPVMVFDGSSIMVWGNISVAGKTRPVTV